MLIVEDVPAWIEISWSDAQANPKCGAEVRGQASVMPPELSTPADMAQRAQPSMGDSLKTPHSVSLKVLRYAS